MAIHCTAIACRHLLRRLLISFSSAASPRLLSHFHQPGPSIQLEPHTASSPRLSLDFLPGDAAVRFNLANSHLGLLFFRLPDLGLPTFLVCDPVSRRHALLRPMPTSAFADGGELTGMALLSRADSRFEFDAVFITVDGGGRPRAWVASFRDCACRWHAQPRSGDITIDRDPYWVEARCVHAAGSLYFHICAKDSVLALDPTTMEFSFLRAPTLIWNDFLHSKYRVGEMPDGRLCVGALEDQKLRLCVQGTDSHDGWVLGKKMCLRNVLDAVPGLRDHPRGRNFSNCLYYIDAGRTGKVFIKTMGCGLFSYHMDTGELKRLTTDDGLDYGDLIFAYFSDQDGGSD